MGYVFTMETTKNSLLTVTAYDQIRYLKNKQFYKYTNKTATQFIQMVADDFHLKTGVLDDTGYVIGRRRDDNSLLDQIETTLDLTLANAKKMFVLYDDFGKLTLKN